MVRNDTESVRSQPDVSLAFPIGESAVIEQPLTFEAGIDSTGTES